MTSLKTIKKTVDKMPVQRRSSNGPPNKVKKQQNKQSKSKTSYDIELKKSGYCSNRLLASLIGYIMAIITYGIIFDLLFVPVFMGKLLDFCENSPILFSILFQPLVTRKSYILPSYSMKCKIENDKYFNGVSLVCCILCNFHFLRRIFEVLCIHKYNRLRPCKEIIYVSIYYIFLISWIGISTNSTIYSIYFIGEMGQKSNPSSIGLILYGIGEIGNSSHHFILSRLRKKNIKGHVIPYGGFFRWISVAHYFFELITWFGFIFLSFASVGSIAIFIFSTLILCRRAIVIHLRYKYEFGDKYPSNRWAIIPFFL